MINSRTIKIYFFTIIIFFLCFLNSNKIFSTENKIIFKINNKPFTSLDYNMRLEYLDFVGNNNNLTQEVIVDDFISANLFYEHYIKTKKRINYEIKVDEIYNNILRINKENDKKYKYDFNKDNILYNIRIDYVRKTLLEEILNKNKKELNISNKEIDILYKIVLEYINFEYNISDELKKEIIKSSNINLEKTIKLLNQNNINYFSKKKEITNIDKINKIIKDKILSNENFLLIEKDNKISLIFIRKSFEMLNGIKVNLFSIRSLEEIDDKNLLCSNLQNNFDNNNTIVNKEYEFKNLNKELKQNLVNINDYVKFIDSNKENIYVVMCDINFNIEELNNNNLNKLINLNVSVIEKKFINTHSKIYNLVIFDE